MPFTFSHPALVLPLGLLPRKWISVTGVVIGSLTPDFEYFLRMKVQSNYSHTLIGMLWFNLPLGLLLAFIFHSIVRTPLFNNLPGFFQSRLSSFQHLNWFNYFKANSITVIISLLIGAFSHVFWDSFTHSHGYFVEEISALNNNITLLGKSVPAFKILQHFSTLLGGLIILFVLYKLPTTRNIKTKVSLKYWNITGISALILFLGRFLVSPESLHIGNIVVTSISAGMIGLIVASLYWRKC